MERRVLKYEFRTSETPSGKMRVAGYAARYNTLSHPIPDGVGGQFYERIAKGAFSRCLRSKDLDCVALMNHDENKPLGRTTAGTLELEEDNDGLAFSCDLPNTSYSRDLYESVKRGDMNQCSFAFNLADGDDEWEQDEDRKLVRTIKNFATLFDVSIVTNAQYPGTSVDARNVVVGAEVRSFLMKRRKPNWGGRRLPAGKSMEDVIEEERAARAAIAATVARRRALLHSIF